VRFALALKLHFDLNAAVAFPITLETFGVTLHLNIDRILK